MYMHMQACTQRTWMCGKYKLGLRTEKFVYIEHVNMHNGENQLKQVRLRYVRRYDYVLDE